MNKIAFRKRILEAASVLFQSRGFQATTMNSIAAKAAIGVATIYKHFRSKEHIICELMVPEIDECLDRADAIVASPAPDPVDALNALIECFFTLGRSSFERPVITQFAVPGLSGKRDLLDEVGEETDRYAKHLVLSLLEGFQANGVIPGSLDVHHMATIVYGVFNQKYIEYLAHEDVTREQAIADLRLLTALLFAPWRCPEVGRTREHRA